MEFQIAPASARALVILPIGLVPVVVVGFVLGASLIGMRNAQFEVSSAGLRLRGDLYGRMILAADLRGGSARLVNMNESTEYQTARRTLGTGLPGYRAGWFRLRNGEKALLYVTDPARVVYIPTRAGYSVLLSARDPEGLLNAIRALAPSS
jgi:hypothetical protein